MLIGCIAIGLEVFRFRSWKNYFFSEFVAKMVGGHPYLNLRIEKKQF